MRCCARSLAYATALLAAAGEAGGQPGDELDGRRDDVLGVLGAVEAADVSLFPLIEGPGVVFTQRLNFAAARGLRVHFEVLRPDSDPASWRVELVRGRDELVWAREGVDVAGNGFWSDEISGNRVTVRVVGTRATNDVRLRIDKAAVWKQPSIPESITGDLNSMEALDHHDPWVLRNATGVARIQFIGTDNNVYACTGFLLAPDLLLTNQHCMTSDEEVESALVDFDYDKESSRVLRVTLGQRLASSVQLDYALVRLARTVERQTLTLDTRPVIDAEELLVIEHPGGKAKRVSRQDCEVGSASVGGRTGELTDFTHLCDTLGSSSGSPVFSLERQTVVGLHHLGFEESDGMLENRAVHSWQLIRDLCETVPNLAVTFIVSEADNSTANKTCETL